MIPSLVLQLGPLLGFVLLGKSHVLPTMGFAGFKWFSAALVGGFVAAWLVWAIQVPRWRRWAYQRVDDIEVLKRQAVAAHIIWPQGHPFERTELTSRRLRQEIRDLEARQRGQQPFHTRP